MVNLAAPVEVRGDLLRAVRLEWLTVGWNLIEGLIAVAVALAAWPCWASVDSFVESAS
jgi:hypothetical protein